jgi:hypothetical protein
VALCTTSRRLAAALPAVALLTAAPSAHAAAILNLQPCYVSVSPDEIQKMRDVIATGFAPDAELDVTVGDTTTGAIADQYGNLDLSGFGAPYQHRGESSFMVTVADHDHAAITTSAISRVTALRVRLRPREANTGDRVRIRGRGFIDDLPIYGHYVFHGKVRRTVRFAHEPHGVCGHFSVRRRQIPLRHPRAGRWLLQVDQQRRWSRRPESVWVPVRITVQQLIGAR